MSCAGHNESIELQKMRCGCYSLRGCVVKAFKASNIDTKPHQLLQFFKLERAVRPDAYRVNLVFDATRPNRLYRKAISNFCQRSFRRQARVQNFKLADRIPSAICHGAAEWIPTFSRDAPNGPFYRLWRKVFQSIEDCSIMDATSTDH
jgi:hypothetical protein